MSAGAFSTTFFSVACWNFKIKWERGKKRLKDLSSQRWRDLCWNFGKQELARKFARCDLPTQQKKNQDPGRWRFLTFPYPCVRALPCFIHRCAVRIPPPPALLFSQNLEQIRGQTVVSFSLQYFFRGERSPKIPGIVHALPLPALRQLEGPSSSPGGMTPLGWGQVSMLTQPHPPFLKFWKEWEKHKPESPQELMITIPTGRCVGVGSWGS